MPIYSVTRKSDGAEVYRYDAAGVIEGTYPLAEHHHTELTLEGEPTGYTGSWLITKRSFWNRLPVYNELAMRAVIRGGVAGSEVLGASLARLAARIESSPYVDLQLGETVDGLWWLASTQVPATVLVDGQAMPLRLTVEQAEAVLTTPPTDSEVWRG